MVVVVSCISGSEKEEEDHHIPGLLKWWWWCIIVFFLLKIPCLLDERTTVNKLRVHQSSVAGARTKTYEFQWWIGFLSHFLTEN